MIDTTHDPATADTAPITADDHQGTQPPDIVVPVADLLAHEVGPLRDLDLTMVDEWTLSWAGVDQSGRCRSGKLTRDFYVGEDGKSIVLAWNIVSHTSQEPDPRCPPTSPAA